jgi:hypothetical protein
MPDLEQTAKWLLGPEAPAESARTHLLPRWIFLRCVGIIYFSAFYSLLFQIKGMIGPNGILPAASYLQDVANYYPGLQRFWFAPTLLWFGAGNHACWSRLKLVATHHIGDLPGLFSVVRCRRTGFLKFSI